MLLEEVMSWFAEGLKGAILAGLSSAASGFTGFLKSQFMKVVLFIVGVLLLFVLIF